MAHINQSETNNTRGSPSRLYYCYEADCTWGQGFRRLSDWRRHQLCCHNRLTKVQKVYHCRAYGCNPAKVWKRVDHMRTHARRVHRNLDEDDLVAKSTFPTTAIEDSPNTTLNSRSFHAAEDIKAIRPHPVVDAELQSRSDILRPCAGKSELRLDADVLAETILPGHDRSRDIAPTWRQDLAPTVSRYPTNPGNDPVLTLQNSDFVSMAKQVPQFEPNTCSLPLSPSLSILAPQPRRHLPTTLTEYVVSSYDALPSEIHRVMPRPRSAPCKIPRCCWQTPRSKSAPPVPPPACHSEGIAQDGDVPYNGFPSGHGNFNGFPNADGHPFSGYPGQLGKGKGRARDGDGTHARPASRSSTPTSRKCDRRFPCVCHLFGLYRRTPAGLLEPKHDPTEFCSTRYEHVSQVDIHHACAAHRLFRCCHNCFEFSRDGRPWRRHREDRRSPYTCVFRCAEVDCPNYNTYRPRGQPCAHGMKNAQRSIWAMEFRLMNKLDLNDRDMWIPNPLRHTQTPPPILPQGHPFAGLCKPPTQIPAPSPMPPIPQDPVPYPGNVLHDMDAQRRAEETLSRRADSLRTLAFLVWPLVNSPVPSWENASPWIRVMYRNNGPFQEAIAAQLGYNVDLIGHDIRNLELLLTFYNVLMTNPIMRTLPAWTEVREWTRTLLRRQVQEDCSWQTWPLGFMTQVPQAGPFQSSAWAPAYQHLPNDPVGDLYGLGNPEMGGMSETAMVDLPGQATRRIDNRHPHANAPRFSTENYAPENYAPENDIQPFQMNAPPHTSHQDPPQQSSLYGVQSLPDGSPSGNSYAAWQSQDGSGVEYQNSFDGSVYEPWQSG